MGPRRLSQLSITGAILVLTLLTPARAGEPSARELVALAPVLDSSDGGCRSLDIGGWYGGDKTPAPKLRFRALYRAPNQFSMLLSDPIDGTPIVLGCGRKMFVYDPVGPTIFYSEDAVFTLEMACTRKEFKFDFKYLLIQRGVHHRIFVDLRSVLLGAEPAEEGGAFGDKVAKRGPSQFEMIRTFFGNGHSLALKVDPMRECPYTAAAFRYGGVTYLSFDRLDLNNVMGNGAIAFPAKRRLSQVLPVKDVTADENPASIRNLEAAVARATLARAVVNGVWPPGPIHIPGLSGVDWDRVRQNDKKFGKALRELIPPSLRTGKREHTSLGDQKWRRSAP